MCRFLVRRHSGAKWGHSVRFARGIRRFGDGRQFKEQILQFGVRQGARRTAQMCGRGAREWCPLWRLRLRSRVRGGHFHDDGVGFRAHGARGGKYVRLCHAQTGSPGRRGCQKHQASTPEISQPHLLAQGAGQGLAQSLVQFVPLACLPGKRDKRLALAHVPGAVTGAGWG